MKATTTLNHGTEILNIELQIKELTNKQLLELDSYLTICFKECIKHIDSNKDKKYNTNVKDFKAIKLNELELTNKDKTVINTGLNIFTKIMKNCNIDLLTKCKLMNFNTLKKLSTLNKTYINKLNTDKKVTELSEDIFIYAKELSKIKNEESFHKKAIKNGYKKA